MPLDGASRSETPCRERCLVRRANIAARPVVRTGPIRRGRSAASSSRIPLRLRRAHPGTPDRLVRSRRSWPARRCARRPSSCPERPRPATTPRSCTRCCGRSGGCRAAPPAAASEMPGVRQRCWPRHARCGYRESAGRLRVAGRPATVGAEPRLLHSPAPISAKARSYAGAPSRRSCPNPPRRRRSPQCQRRVGPATAPLRGPIDRWQRQQHSNRRPVRCECLTRAARPAEDHRPPTPHGRTRPLPAVPWDRVERLRPGARSWRSGARPTWAYSPQLLAERRRRPVRHLPDPQRAILTNPGPDVGGRKQVSGSDLTPDKQTAPSAEADQRGAAQ